MAETRLFASFLQAGFECSTHKLRSGKRLDLVHSTQHDKFVQQDYARLQNICVRTVREGLRWHIIESEPGRYDFSSVRRMLDAAAKHSIEIIWDGLHFGWPDFVDVFSPEWVHAFVAFMAEFATVLRSAGAGRAFIAPVNEISFVSWGGGDANILNPFCTGRGHELKRQLVRAAIGASRVIRRELPQARLVSPEPVIHIAGDPRNPEDMRQAEEYRTSMFQSWDMLAGRLDPELGGAESLLEIIGVNFYDRNQWWNFGQTIRRGEPAYRPFREILAEVYGRYRRPLFVAETGTEEDDRPAWFAYIWEEVQAAIAAGVPVEGLCLYPIVNHPGWDDDRHCRNGLWDYASPTGEREIYRPLENEIRKRIKTDLRKVQ